MKKILFFAVAFVTFCGIAQAQYKPTKGTFSTEVNFTPFSFTDNSSGTDNKIFSLSEMGIKGRFFISDMLAVRAGLGFGMQSHTQHDFSAPGATTETEDITTDNVIAFSFAPGIEYHFGSWEKTSLYVGAEIGLKVRGASTSAEGDGYDDKQTGYSDYYGIGSGVGFNFNIVTGFDHYFTESLYVGAELGLGVGTFIQGEVETTSNGVSALNKDYYSETSTGFFCNPAIRLGWKF